jgi:CHAD domain-containing protein
MVTEHREVERKYEADSPVLTLPPLDDLPQVASVSATEKETLEADYYDTGDLRLISAGVTLRRREGGHDEGWHLKLPAGPDARRELWWPLLERETGVPAEPAGLVRAYSRGRPLQPVAHISTVRHRRVLLGADGASLAEVVADDVSSQTMGRTTTIIGWQEAEVELTGGDGRLLEATDKLLRRSGLRPARHAAKLQRALGDRMPAASSPATLTRKSSAGEVVLGYLREQASVMRNSDPLVRRGEPDSVHQMRIASRRLRSTLQSFGTIVRRGGTAHLIGELRWLGRVLGEARDGEVLAGRLSGLVGQVPPELLMGPVAARLRVHFAPLEAAADQGVREALDSDRYIALLDELARLLASPPLAAAARQPAGDELPRAVARAFKRVRRRMRRALAMPPGNRRENALHGARKAAKRARYAAETLLPVSGDQARRFGQKMKKIQSVLGDHQDAVLTRAALRELGVEAALAGENAFAYGVLHEHEQAETVRLQSQAGRVWQRASRAKYRRWLG